jgi:hypothetical protein
MKINESLGSNLRSAITDELGKSGVITNGGIDAIIAANEFKNEIPENNKKTKIIKKPMKKGVTNKLVSKTKMKTPIGKLTMGLPIMGEEGETSESTGSGSAGGFSAPLFSTTKKEMQEKCWTGYQQKGMKKKGDKNVPNCVKEGNESDVKKVEATEATDSGSSGSYETNSAWAKSTSKKDWRGESKTQIPGGKFVQVKKKCQKFPYCNQGDIKALKIFENEKVKNAIQNLSKRHNISENVIKTIIAYEYENTFSKK